MMELSIPGYVIKETIYTGGQSIVYRGVRIKDEQVVVIKTPAHRYSTRKAISKYKEEVEIAKLVNSQYVIKLYSFEDFPNICIITMENVEGVVLAKKIRPQGLPLRQFLNYAIQISKGLEAIHQCHITHRDINPKNIIVDLNDQIKILDFGLASIIRVDQTRVSSPTTIKGTLAYISPEQTTRINRAVDKVSDLYSLGVTLYEMICGFLPFMSDDPLELIHYHIAMTPIAPSNYLTCDEQPIPIMISEIIMKLLKKNADDRYVSAFFVFSFFLFFFLFFLFFFLIN